MSIPNSVDSTPFAPFPPLEELARQLACGATSSRALTEAALERIAEPSGQGAVVFVKVDAAAARRTADACDALRAAGTVLSPLMGIPVSIKDLFDVAGQVTRAGSKVLDGAAPAAADAPVVARLRHAGAVLIGRTNMTEFAFSGLGVNPHYGTPASPWRRGDGARERRIAGGSTSGGAASVADGMAAVALGSDTGGSLRIPAALCALSAFKPTASRVPTAGGVPLSTTLDSFGPIGNTVACCAIVDRILAALPPIAPPTRSLKGARIGALTHYVTDGVDASVAHAYDEALKHLSNAGAIIEALHFAPIERLPEINRHTLAAMEAYAWHRKFIDSQRDVYDPRILARILKGAQPIAADYIDLLAERAAIIAAAEPLWHRFDAVVCPTVPIVPPRVDELEQDDDAYGRANSMLLRNPSVFNFLDGCALSLPCAPRGEAPVGLMLASGAGRDDALLALGRAVEAVLAGHRNHDSHAPRVAADPR
jgi:aspartyl-tRNA(Asn)/glutamyl-tRNA(Gln) amidotransferase subunit A